MWYLIRIITKCNWFNNCFYVQKNTLEKGHYTKTFYLPRKRLFLKDGFWSVIRLFVCLFVRERASESESDKDEFFCQWFFSCSWYARPMQRKNSAAAVDNKHRILEKISRSNTRILSIIKIDYNRQGILTS